MKAEQTDRPGVLMLTSKRFGDDPILLSKVYDSVARPAHGIAMQRQAVSRRCRHENGLTRTAAGLPRSVRRVGCADILREADDLKAKMS